ncbi:UNVERIFIED_CONTAM: hypothetical protein GTU68_047102, partial [Idotea baltica]|nr:hypothetical protein [Idotea baltica]
MGATCFVQPLDLVKNRMQVAKSKSIKRVYMLYDMLLRMKGIPALYSGLSAGLLRQATYYNYKIGYIHLALLKKASGPNGEPPSFIKKAVMGMAAGVVGSFVGTPAEISLIRMTSDGRLPPAERRNYKNVFDALFRI